MFQSKQGVSWWVGLAGCRPQTLKEFRHSGCLFFDPAAIYPLSIEQSQTFGELQNNRAVLQTCTHTNRVQSHRAHEQHYLICFFLGAIAAPQLPKTKEHVNACRAIYLPAQHEGLCLVCCAQPVPCKCETHPTVPATQNKPLTEQPPWRQQSAWPSSIGLAEQ